jgi:acyl-CoA thioester hydrolase
MAGTPTYRGTVQRWHCDHMDHMNVMHYVGKFDEATWVLFAELGITGSYLRDRGKGMAAVQQNITYRRELMAGAVVTVTSRVLEVRDKLIRFVHEMRDGESGEVAALCELTGVHIDRTTRRSCPFPEAIQSKAEAAMDNTHLAT